MHARGNLMSVRLLLTDEAWAEIAPILTASKSRAGSPPVLSDRMVIEAVLSLARTAGHCQESPGFDTVLAQGPPEPPLTHAMMDKGYDSDRLREQRLAQDI